MREDIPRPKKITKDESEEIMDKVGANFELLQEIESDLISPYIKDLDKIIKRIQEILKRDNKDISNKELSQFILELPTTLYFTSEGVEKLALKETIMTAIKNDFYNRTNLRATGNIEARKAIADLATQKEQLMQALYKSAYRTIKFKIDIGFELINSLKKILSDRMVSFERERRN